MRPTRFHLYSILVGGLLLSLVLIDSALGQRPQRGGQGGFGGGGGGAPGGFGGGQGGGGFGGQGGGGGFGGQGGGFGGRGGMGGGPGGGGGRMGGGGDPSQFFTMLSQGADTLPVDTLITFLQRRDPNAGEAVNQFLQANGIANGVLTREQFALYLQQAQQQRGGQGGGNRRMPFNEDAAKQLFAQLDKNSDGYLTEDEMTPDLKAIWQQFDKDKDGKLSLDEYMDFARARSSQGRGGPGGFGEGENEEPYEEDKRQLVYRANNLPKELPPWFGQLDRDKDAQVSLYEWKAAGRSVDDFLKYDLNGDGFLTIDEVLRIEGRNRPAGQGMDSLAAVFGGGPGGMGAGPGGFGPGGFGPGQGRGAGPGGMGAGPGGMGGGPGGRGNGGGGGGPGGRGNGGGGRGNGGGGPGGAPGGGGRMNRGGGN